MVTASKLIIWVNQAETKPSSFACHTPAMPDSRSFASTIVPIRIAPPYADEFAPLAAS